jgi:hypothetical protein
MFSASQSDDRQTGCQSGGFILRLHPQGYGSSSGPQLLGPAVREPIVGRCIVAL